MSEAIAAFCVKAYTFLLPISWIGVAIVVLVLLPMALFKATRPAAGTGMYFSSYLFGLTTWFLDATVTFVTWGWVGLIIGLIIAVVGVVPIAILASFISLKEPILGFSLIVMVLIVFATRMGGMALMQSGIKV
jgi:uncharacterized protein YacL